MTEEMNQIDVQVPEVGDVVKGIVTKVEDKHVDVEIINVKQSGIIPISELSSLHVEKASDVVKVDDELDLKVTKVEDDALILSKRAVDADRAWEDLEKKFETKEVFEAEVKDVVKGGLVVDIGVRGFIPASLVEAHFVEDFTDYKGKTLSLLVVELDRDKNRVILSHRAVVESEQANKKQELLQSLEVGSVLDGKVQRLTDFGAFVDIGGIDGLVHISQLSHSHVEKPSDVVEEGQEVKVKVLSVDRDNERISLSIKDTLPGPWNQIGEKVKPGDVLEGTVQRLVSFGAFVEILPGVEGLVHISQISNKHIGTPHEVLEEGQTVKVKVLDVNENEERISLSMRELEETPKADQEDYRQYQAKEETSTGFQLGDLIGDKLNKLK
ncbi:30S ribosomal protein S1 [Bacillus subtilis subsp. subtilis]|uniref:Small ribosomal subunit protein bS1 homolog n=4 Tax=Bacillus subtilis group TaxID=653685 RepID=RS1H_BACSU|nr:MULTISPECIES: 30S ribosomal protein S1 [Bacillales]NP_390169.1 RNA degradation presenting factor (ribosomal protein S1 homolog) [Bacillus subtilis subsp. subtilis str. 168]P38494.1 RecName: Full=Small ribosomal subunit protein bS1 homolog; AltName: Full=30S ribosomal protein S1 homolog [Bacillus subtilis subsp. subtilis str. 168]MDP4112127.1 30S ribosomal protein S1 [Bacillota bacterium]BAM52771.1 30S ribosomal protein S1 [Bacillus subtilis BEST7613]AAA85150.1 unknown [Bacillus subtilis sub